MNHLAIQSPATLRKEKIDENKLTQRFIQDNLLLKNLSRIERISLIWYRNRTGSTAMLTIFVILQYHKTHNTYPDSLEMLIQNGLIKELPIDPFSDAPLVYRKTGDGFTLYSVGLNFIDDGGVMGKDSKGKATLWSEKGGDAVFWPVLKE
jgi:hypothetical protein